MACDCISTVNEQLSHLNAGLDISTLMDWKTGKSWPSPVSIATYKLDPKGRKPLPKLFALFCPFCGEKCGERGMAEVVSE